MYKIILLIAILGLVLYKKNKIVEPIVASCCGGVKAHENRSRAPKKIRRCLKNEEWYMPCTNQGSPDCCSGEDRCIPSRHGGKCQRKDGSGHYIYDGDEQVEYNRSEHDTEHDTEVYDDDYDDDDDDDDNDDHIDLNMDKYLNLDYLNYFIIVCICLFIIYLLYHLFFEKNITSHKYKTQIHHHDYGKSNNKYGQSRYVQNRYFQNRYGSKKYSWQR